MNIHLQNDIHLAGCPYEHYNFLLGHWNKYCMDTVFGWEKPAAIRRDAALSLGPESDLEYEKELLEQHRITLFSMSLVYLVARLESMVKDYTRFLLSPKRKYEESLTSDNDCKYPESKYHNGKLLQKTEAWKKQVGNWISEVFEESDVNSTNQIVKCKIQLCALSLSRWPVLITSVALRNLETHNRGVMNKRTYELAPLCEIGEKPAWDIGLLYDLQTAISLLNCQLAKIRID